MALHKKAARTAVFLVGKAGPPMRSFSAHVTFAKRFCGIHIAAESRTARIRNPLLSARYFFRPGKNVLRIMYSLEPLSSLQNRRK